VRRVEKARRAKADAARAQDQSLEQDDRRQLRPAEASASKVA